MRTASGTDHPQAVQLVRRNERGRFIPTGEFYILLRDTGLLTGQHHDLLHRQFDHQQEALRGNQA